MTSSGPEPGGEPGSAEAAAGRDLRAETVTAVEHTQLSPLSIQAASLVRSMDALSRVFWISLGGTFLTLFFAALAQLQLNAGTDFIALGEYLVPKSIVPLGALLFAVFVFWLTANRMRMLAYVLCSSRLPDTMVDEIFRLNPPVLNVFDEDNARRWSPFNGVGVLIINWAVFFGNSVTLIFFAAVQRGAAAADFDFAQLWLYLLGTLAALCYGCISIFPPLRQILSELHDMEFRIGWPRKLLGLVLIGVVVVTQNTDQLMNPAGSGDDLVGPAIANAIDGETLYLLGLEVQLFGIDAMELDQVCQQADGTQYPCGREAAQSLQQLVQNNDVFCKRLFAVNRSRIVGVCALHTSNAPLPEDDDAFFAMYGADLLSRLQVERGYALSVGVGERLMAEEQNQAQTLRLGIWRGSFQPPASFRSQRD